MAHVVRPRQQEEYLPPVVFSGSRLHRQVSPAEVQTLDAEYSAWHGWQAMRESLRKSREISPTTAAPRLPLSSASIIPESCQAPSVGPINLRRSVRCGKEMVRGCPRVAGSRSTLWAKKGFSTASDAQLFADSSSVSSALIWVARASSAALSKSAPLSDPASSSRFR